MNIPWDDLRLFLEVAETGSLSKASLRLGLAQPSVSRRLAALEAALGETLFRRSAQGTALTAYGERLLAPARRMAEWAGEAARVAEGREDAPTGVVRITAPPGVALELLAPFAAHLRGELPLIQLEVVSSVAFLDVGRREVDLALRNQPPLDADLVVVASLQMEAVPVATAAYRARLPARYRPADVDWIGWAPPYDHLPPNPQLKQLIPGFRPAFTSDDFAVQWHALLSGVGAMFVARVRHRFQRENGLEELALGQPSYPAGLHLVCAKSALDIPRVRAVADVLATEMKAAARLSKRHGLKVSFSSGR